MGALKNTNEGWNRERLVEAIVGKVAFVQTPDKPGDDFGVDLIGFFKVDHPIRSDMHVPSLPFHLQVKPKSDPKFIAKHIHELTRLYAPFYYAVGNTEKQTVTIYSGLGIVGLSMKDDRDELCRKVYTGNLKVKLKLTRTTLPNAGLPRLEADGSIVVDFYKVAVLTTSTKINSEEVKRWRADCAAFIRSIESYNSGEFVLESYRGTVAQAVGIGTFSHAIKRMMHSATMLAETIHHNHTQQMRSSQVGPPKEDLTFLITLGYIARYLNGLRTRISDKSILDVVIDENRWGAWLDNTTGIANTAELEMDTAELKPSGE